MSHNHWFSLECVLAYLTLDVTQPRLSQLINVSVSSTARQHLFSTASPSASPSHLSWSWLFTFWSSSNSRQLDQKTSPKKRRNLTGTGKQQNMWQYFPSKRHRIMPYQCVFHVHSILLHRKVTRLVLTVITVYILCWLPYWITQVWSQAPFYWHHFTFQNRRGFDYD